MIRTALQGNNPSQIVPGQGRNLGRGWNSDASRDLGNSPFSYLEIIMKGFFSN